MIAPTPPDHGGICLAQCAVAHQLTPIGRWIEQRGDLGLGQLLSAHQPCLPGGLDPADPGQGVDERAAPGAKDAQNRGLHGAAVDAELLSLADFHGPAPERSQFVRLCYKNGPFVSSGRKGRVPGRAARRSR